MAKLKLKLGDKVLSGKLKYTAKDMVDLADEGIISLRKEAGKYTFVARHGHAPQWIVVRDDKDRQVLYHETEIRIPQ